MKVWIFDIMLWPKEGHRKAFPYPGSLWDSQAAMESYHGHIRYLQRADELGFDGVCLAEHHFAPYGICPSPNVMAAVVATHTSHVKIGILGNCLPLHGHPVRLAEELAMVDVLSKGRLVSGFVRGGFPEYYAYNLDMSQSRGRFEEAWDLIVKCWTEVDEFAWQGKYFNYENISIMPRPVQTPHPPIVCAANTAESLEWLARKRIPLASSFASTKSIQETFDYYRKYAQQECGWTPGPESLTVSRQVYVAPTNKQAHEEVDNYLVAFFDEVPVARRYENPKIEELRRGTRTERSHSYKKEPAGHQFLVDSLTGKAVVDELQREGLCIVGDPDAVTQEIKHQQEVLGVGTYMLYSPFSTLPLSMATKSLELFAKEVLPNLRD